MKIVINLAILMAILVQSTAAQALAPRRIVLQGGRTFTLNLPPGYEMIPAAEGLKRVRFFAVAPDGRIFVTDMHDLTDNAKGAVYILEDFDRATGKFRRVTPYLTNLRNPNSAQFYTDERGQDWFYLAETDKLTRRRFTRGESKPTDTKPQTLATFPDYGLSYKYGGWHLTRTIAFSPARKLYVSVGSSCNACAEKEAVRATVLEMEPDGSKRRTLAKGLRNAVGLKWVDGRLWATNQGSDHLGLNRPDETFYQIKAADYGWPSCYQANGRVRRDPAYDRLKNCLAVPRSFAFFPAHSSAMGFDYFDGSAPDPELRDSFLVSLHGSTNKDLGKGYKVVQVGRDGRTKDFITGFLQRKTVNGRPCDILRLEDGSFLLTDDYAGVIYFLRKVRMAG